MVKPVLFAVATSKIVSCSSQIQDIHIALAMIEYRNQLSSDSEDEPQEFVDAHEFQDWSSIPNVWEKFNKSTPIPGFKECIVTMFSLFSEGKNVRMNECTTRQVELGSEVCRYLVHNGILSIGVASNCMEYVLPLYKKFELKNTNPNIKIGLLREDSNVDNSKSVTVIILQGKLGEWNQSQMFEVIHRAIMNSSMGIIIIANEIILEHPINKNWKMFIEFLDKSKLLKGSLEIFCCQHDELVQIDTAKDLKRASPLGGCKKFCGFMTCGHHCPYACHNIDSEHSAQYRCQYPCERTCSKGHRCGKQCWEDCTVCEFLVTVNYNCVHQSVVNKQVLCPEEESVKCNAPVRLKLPCGHSTIIPCCKVKDDFLCEELVGEQLPCGHGIVYKCHEKETMSTKCRIPVKLKRKDCNHGIIVMCYQLKFVKMGLLKCNKTCDMMLPCGHICKRNCHPDDPLHQKNPCLYPCEKKCPRRVHVCNGKGHKCSEPCPDSCMERFDYQLNCNHFVPIICSEPDPDEDLYKCKERCLRKLLCLQRHPCNKLCYEECGECEYQMISTCQREHRTAYACNEPRPLCKELVSIRLSICNHLISLLCHEIDYIPRDEFQKRCRHVCHFNFTGENECFHQCRGCCGDCYQGRYHARCLEPCDKLLICGHSCKTTCSLVCRPCTLACENNCEHKRCLLECGVPCDPICEEPCSYSCEHSKCSKICSDECDKKTCYEPCPKLLNCGHPCIGYCGELCPPFCRICEPDRLNAELFDGDSDDEDDRYVYLEACKHCIKEEYLLKWIEFSSESTQEIRPLKCPICNTKMKLIRRFSSLFHANQRSINQIRRVIFGSDEKIEEILNGTKQKIKSFLDTFSYIPFSKENYFDILKEEMENKFVVFSVPRRNETYFFHSIDLEKAKCIEWICNQVIDGCKDIMLCDGYGFHKYQKRLIKEWNSYLHKLYTSAWPLHPNEANAANKERRRLDDYANLYTRISKASAFLETFIGKEMLTAAEQVLDNPEPYTEERRTKFRQRLTELDNAMNFKANVTEQERQEIVGAFGQRAGRWFKCVNGHPYVITECGGATEISQCNECGALIGGSEHRLLSQNYLSPEMDNAFTPLYPTMAERDEQDE